METGNKIVCYALLFYFRNVIFILGTLSAYFTFFPSEMFSAPDQSDVTKPTYHKGLLWKYLITMQNKQIWWKISIQSAVFHLPGSATVLGTTRRTKRNKDLKFYLRNSKTPRNLRHLLVFLQISWLLYGVYIWPTNFPHETAIENRPALTKQNINNLHCIARIAQSWELTGETELVLIFFLLV